MSLMERLPAPPIQPVDLGGVRFPCGSGVIWRRSGSPGVFMGFKTPGKNRMVRSIPLFSLRRIAISPL